MKQDGLILAPSTVDDWHQGVCDKIEPLYNLQMDRVMSSLLLGADGRQNCVFLSQNQKNDAAVQRYNIFLRYAIRC